MNGRMIAAVMAVAALAACSRTKEVSVDDAVVRLAAVPGRPAGAYFTLHGGAPDTALTAVSADLAGRAELHESRMTQGGGMTMDSLPRVALPAGATVRFAPAGRHVMLFDVAPAVSPGATMTLALSLADGRTVRVPAKVIAAGDPMPDAR